jgi:hypothetical protein
VRTLCALAGLPALALRCRAFSITWRGGGACSAANSFPAPVSASTLTSDGALIFGEAVGC